MLPLRDTAGLVVSALVALREQVLAGAVIVIVMKSVVLLGGVAGAQAGMRRSHRVWLHRQRGRPAVPGVGGGGPGGPNLFELFSNEHVVRRRCALVPGFAMQNVVLGRLACVHCPTISIECRPHHTNKPLRCLLLALAR